MEVIGNLLTGCSVGPHSVRRGQIVYVNDSNLTGAPADGENAGNILDQNAFGRSPVIRLRVFVNSLDQMFGETDALDLPIMAFTSSFGPDPSLPKNDNNPLRLQSKAGNLLSWSNDNDLGCKPYAENAIPKGSVVIARRGECPFIEKLTNAAQAGASGVIVMNTDDQGVNPSADVEDVQKAGALINDAVLVVVSQSAGKDILRLMEIASKHGFTDVMVAVDTEDKSKKGESQGSKRRRKQSVDQNRILYLNGHPLLNTRLIV